MITESKIVSVPFVFRMPDHNHYPANNWPDGEYWFSENIKDADIIGDRMYLRVIWTSYYKNICNYGNNKDQIKVLQDWIDKLDTSKKYWTVVQFDDGILNDISHLDIKVFSMAGGRKDYGLPLICQPNKYKFDVKRDLFASFAGRITHPLRQQMIDALKDKEDYYITTNHNDIASYCGLMARSIFSLCPRGYSQTSFRISESIEMGSIPVYLSDEFFPIHDLDFNTFGVTIESKDIHIIDEILKAIPEKEIQHKQGLLPDIFEKYFSFEGNKKLVLENL